MRTQPVKNIHHVWWKGSSGVSSLTSVTVVERQFWRININEIAYMTQTVDRCTLQTAVTMYVSKNMAAFTGWYDEVISNLMLRRKKLGAIHFLKSWRFRWQWVFILLGIRVMVAVFYSLAGGYYCWVSN